jgi:hypothetical protein
MKPLAVFLVSAAFASLLAGCPIYGECGGEIDSSINLTREEYAKWQHGLNPDDTAPTTGAAGDELLSEQELCEAVCDYHLNTTLLSCFVDEQSDKVVVRCKVFYQCHESPSDSATPP